MRNWLSDLIACALLGLFLAAVSMGLVHIMNALVMATGLTPFWAFALFYTVVFWLSILGD